MYILLIYLTVNIYNLYWNFKQNFLFSLFFLLRNPSLVTNKNIYTFMRNLKMQKSLVGKITHSNNINLLFICR